MLRLCVDCETWQYLDMFRVNLKNNATDLFGMSSMRLFSSLVFAMTATISSLIFVTYTSLSVASLNTFQRSVAIANSDLTTLWARRYTLKSASVFVPSRSTAYDYYSSPPKCSTMLTLSRRLPSRPIGPGGGH